MTPSPRQFTELNLFPGEKLLHVQELPWRTGELWDSEFPGNCILLIIILLLPAYTCWCLAPVLLPWWCGILLCGLLVQLGLHLYRAFHCKRWRAFTSERIIWGCRMPHKTILEYCSIRHLSFESRHHHLLLKAGHNIPESEMDLAEDASDLCRELQEAQQKAPALVSLQQKKGNHPLVPSGERLYGSGTLEQTSGESPGVYLTTALLDLFYLSQAVAALFFHFTHAAEVWMPAIWICWGVQCVCMGAWSWSLVSEAWNHEAVEYAIGSKGIYRKGDAPGEPWYKRPTLSATHTKTLLPDGTASLLYATGAEAQVCYHNLPMSIHHTEVESILWRLAQEND